MCIYGFNKDGYCDASFKLDGGDLAGTGAFSFTTTSFTVAMTGGKASSRMVGGDDRDAYDNPCPTPRVFTCEAIGASAVAARLLTAHQPEIPVGKDAKGSPALLTPANRS